MSVVGDLVRLVFSQNSGALFGLFRDNASIFGIVSLAVIGLIVAYHGRAGRSLYLSIALGLLLGGALGNLTDRLRLGYVVDFVDIGIGDFRWYTFNVADAAISLAIVMLIGAAFIPAIGRLVERAVGWLIPPTRRASACCGSPTARAAGSTATSPTPRGCRGATSRS